MRHSRLIAFLLLAAVLVLLLAPISDALDRHEYIHGGDAELTLCVFLCAATAAFWGKRLVEACRKIVSRVVALVTSAADLVRLPADSPAPLASPGSPPILSPIRI